MSQRQPGVAIALVESVDDPQGEGRIRLKFPWLPDETQSTWAPIAVPMAGPGRGVFFMPEVGDEALVAFEHGSFDHPYVIGFLWNGSDQPPAAGNGDVRRIRTVSGHVVDFDDRGGQEGITITTKGGDKIELKDVTPSITIETPGGQRIRMDDAPPSIVVTSGSNSIMLNPAGLTVTRGGTSVVMTDGAMAVSTSGPLSVQATAVNLQASAVVVQAAAIAINAAFTSFAGVVQVPTLVAGTVVSSTYTPGVGNLL